MQDEVLRLIYLGRSLRSGSESLVNSACCHVNGSRAFSKCVALRVRRIARREFYGTLKHSDSQKKKAAEKWNLLFSAALWLKTPTSIFLQKIFFRKYHHRRLSAFGELGFEFLQVAVLQFFECRLLRCIGGAQGCYVFELRR